LVTAIAVTADLAEYHPTVQFAYTAVAAVLLKELKEPNNCTYSDLV
jgi:hypothetical protein